MSRVSILTIVNNGIDRTNDPAVVGARSDRIWYGPVTLYAGSEPHMTVAVAGARGELRRHHRRRST